MIQVEDAPGWRPHRGLPKADVVYEYLTERGISRFTLLYWNPSGGFRIEPVRSPPLVTLRLVLFYSGASDHVHAHRQRIVERRPLFARDSARPAPHNLYTAGDQLHQCLSGLHVTVSYPPPATGESA